MVPGTDDSKLNINDVVTVNETGATYGSLLRSMFQIVDVNSNTFDDPLGLYQVRPVLHTYDAFQFTTGSAEVFTADYGSFYVSEDASSGYLVIEFEGSPESIKLKAVSQFVYNSATGVQDENESWTDMWFVIDGDNFTLTATEGDAASFFMANARDLLDINIDEGSDFNPASIEWQTNAFAAFPEEVWDFDDSDFFGKFLEDVDDGLETQFDNTTAASTAALDEIETTLTAEGASLRYSKEVYLTFRESLLSGTFGAHDLYNSQVGENTVAYVYFTNASGDNGVHHPFMVIASHNASAGPNFLIDVARPPGDGTPGTDSVPKSVSGLKKRFPTINFIVINNDKYYYERINWRNRIKIN